VVISTQLSRGFDSGGGDGAAVMHPIFGQMLSNDEQFSKETQLSCQNSYM
jgi:hypothetical protein